MFLINGSWRRNLSAGDRAFQFGDGCFTTARITAGSVCFFGQHLQRLAADCQRLAISGVNWSQLADEMSQLAAEHHSAVLKVIITRGEGERGYRPPKHGTAGRILMISGYPQHYSVWRQQGICLALSPVRLGRNPHLAGIKHLNRLEQVLIRQHMDDNAEEALVLDSEGLLTECCAANLFWRQGNIVYTPLLDQCGVNGLMRQHIIGLLTDSNWQLEQVQAPLSALQQASELIICNALLPVVPVRKAHCWQFHSRELYQFLAGNCEVNCH